MFKALALIGLLASSVFVTRADKFENDDLIVNFDGRSGGFRITSPQFNQTNHFWHVKWDRIEECSILGREVDRGRKFEFNEDLTPEIINEPTSQTLRLSFVDERRDIIIDNTIFNVTSSIPYGNSTIIVDPNMVKFSMTINRWDFSSLSEALCLRLKVSTNFANDVEEAEIHNEDHDRVAFSRKGFRKQDHKVKYGHVGNFNGVFLTPNTVIIDGVEREAIITQNRGGVIQIQIPRFQRYAYYDPVSYIEDSLISSNASTIGFNVMAGLFIAFLGFLTL